MCFCLYCSKNTRVQKEASLLLECSHIFSFFQQSYIAYLWAKSSWTVPLFHQQHVMNLIQRLLFVAFSVVANMGILYYHWTTPPHPKFTVLRKSRISIRAHLLSGTINVCLPIAAFCTVNKDISTTIMWITVFFDIIHLITVLIQTPDVNGQRVLTIPAYQFISLVKIVSVSGLISALLDSSLYQLERLEWLWSVWANHQTYAWVRVWINALYFLQACGESRYTVSVIIAGTIGAGQAYGFTIMIGLILWLVAFNIILRRMTYLLVAKFSVKKTYSEKEQQELNLEMSAMLQFFHESHHSLYHDSRYRTRVTVVQKILFDLEYVKTIVDSTGNEISQQFAPIRTIPDEVQARCVFESIDFDGSGGLDILELGQVIHF